MPEEEALFPESWREPVFSPAVFLRRLNRFLAEVKVPGEGVQFAHVPTSGRLTELLLPGAEARVIRHDRQPGRKTRYTLALVRIGRIWVDLRAARANFLFAEALRRGLIPSLAGFTPWKREVRYRESRFDFLLRERVIGEKEGIGPRLCLVEVKSVTLVQEGVGLFPDAPTQRGARHLVDLRQAVAEKWRGAVVFVVQRPDATVVAPNEAMDRDFSVELRQAVSAGVEVYGVGCLVSDAEGAVPAFSLPVRLG